MFVLQLHLSRILKGGIFMPDAFIYYEDSEYRKCSKCPLNILNTICINLVCSNLLEASETN